MSDFEHKLQDLSNYEKEIIISKTGIANNIKIVDKSNNKKVEKINKVENKKISFIDLCCGIGGFHKGLLPFNCVFACDIDKNCRHSYKTNYNIEPHSDIFDIKCKDIPDHNILCAGFPCQPYSSAGLKKGLNDNRSKVFDKILEIIKNKIPEIIILENVKNLLIMNEGKIFDKIKNDIEKLGYIISYCLLNTSNFGLAQNRERLFIVGTNKNKYKNKIFDFKPLLNINNNVYLKDIIENINDYIDSTKYVIIDKKYINKQKSGLVFCGYIKGNIRKKGSMPNTEHLSRVHKQPNRIYHINGVNPTLSSSESSGRYYIYDDKGVRTLRLNECYNIMGFNNFILHEKKSIAYNQIGNSVSPIIINKIKDELLNQNFF